MDCSKRDRVVAGLPDDVLVEILSRVPAKSLCRFKCVSRAWRDLITDPHHRKKLPQAMEGFFLLDALQAHDTCFYLWNLSFIDLTTRSVPLNIDPSFSVLTGLPEIQSLVLLNSCNGLMLLEHRPKPDSRNVLGYIVFNPTTKQWGTVPTSGCPISTLDKRYTYLAFDPAISSHFHLLLWIEHYEFEEDGGNWEITMSLYAYSSEIGAWSHSQTDWDEQDKKGLKGWHHTGECTLRLHAFFRNMLHLFVWNRDLDEHQILAVDVQGKTQMMISLPVPLPLPADGSLWCQHAIAHSQGLLHYIREDFDANSTKPFRLLVWVLQDYDAKEWVRKDTGCLLKLLGKLDCIDLLPAMHQDCNVLFFVQVPKQKLIAYDMDRKEERVFTPSGNKIFYDIVAPYVPYFAESPALASRA